MFCTKSCFAKLLGAALIVLLLDAATPILRADEPPVPYDGKTLIPNGKLTDYYPLILSRHFSDPAIATWIEKWRGSDTGAFEPFAQQELAKCLEKTDVPSSDLCHLGKEFFEAGAQPGMEFFARGADAEQKIGIKCFDRALEIGQSELTKAGAGSDAAVKILDGLKPLRPLLFYTNQWDAIHKYCALEITFDRPGSTDIWHAMNLDSLALWHSERFPDALAASQKALTLAKDGSYKDIPASKIHELQIQIAVITRNLGRYDDAIKQYRVLADGENNLTMKRQLLDELSQCYLALHKNDEAQNVLKEIYQVAAQMKAPPSTTQAATKPNVDRP